MDTDDDDDQEQRDDADRAGGLAEDRDAAGVPAVPARTRPRATDRGPSRGWAPSPLGFVRRVWVAAYEDNVFFLASALTFDALVAALPFILLALAFLGYVVQGDRDTLTSVHALLDRFLPMHAGLADPLSPAERILARVTESRGQLSALGVPLFIWFSTRFYTGVRAGLNDVFDTEESRPWPVGKAVDFALVIVSLFGLFCWLGFRIARTAPDAFGQYLATGLTATVALAALLHMSVTLGLMPTTGLAFPFMSYGRSGLVMALISPWVALALSGNPEVRDDLALLIRFLLPSYAALGVCMLVVSAGNALGWPLRAMLISSARLFLFYLPCLWVGARLGGIAGLALGAALGNLLAGLAAWRVLRRILASSRRRRAIGV